MDEEIAALEQENEQMTARVAELEQENAELKAENEEMAAALGLDSQPSDVNADVAPPEAQ
jgi:regulator of replication initiation timing